MTTEQFAALALVQAAEADQEPLEALEPLVVAEKGAWVPRSLRDVEWALECIADAEAEQAAIDQQLADLMARAEARVASIKEKAERRATYFRGRVAEYAEEHKAELLTGKKKSRELLSGRLSWRKKGGRLTVTNKLDLMVWLSTQPTELYRVEILPEMKALQARFQKDGTIPPGCEYEPERDELSVEAVPLTLTATTKKELP